MSDRRMFFLLLMVDPGDSALQRRRVGQRQTCVRRRDSSLAQVERAPADALSRFLRACPVSLRAGRGCDDGGLM